MVVSSPKMIQKPSIRKINRLRSLQDSHVLEKIPMKSSVFTSERFTSTVVQRGNITIGRILSRLRPANFFQRVTDLTCDWMILEPALPHGVAVSENEYGAASLGLVTIWRCAWAKIRGERIEDKQNKLEMKASVYPAER